jgi:hypothetical protein
VHRLIASPAGSTTSTAPRPNRPRPTISSTSDGVAPPSVLDRGTDHVAIARSLALYGRWLEWHDPDPRLVDRAYAPGSAFARDMSRTVTEMTRLRERIEEVDRAPLGFVVVSERANVVSFRLTEQLASRDLVRVDGRPLRHAGPATEHYVVIVTRVAADAPWRLLVIERQSPPIEVQL